MMKITIEGPQGCGKTQLARILREVFALKNMTVVVRDGDGWTEGGIPKNPDVEIICQMSEMAAEDGRE